MHYYFVLVELHYLLHALRRSPAFAAVSVLSLTLGIGAAAALFSLVDTVLLKPLPYHEPDQLVFLREVVPPLAHVYPTLPVNIQHLRFWQQQSRTFDGLAAFGSRNSSLRGAEPEPVGGVVCTANLFHVLGVDMQLGHGFAAEDEQPGRNDKVVITDSLLAPALSGRARHRRPPGFAGRRSAHDRRRLAGHFPLCQARRSGSAFTP